MTISVKPYINCGLFASPFSRLCTKLIDGVTIIIIIIFAILQGHTESSTVYKHTYLDRYKQTLWYDDLSTYFFNKSNRSISIAKSQASISALCFMSYGIISVANFTRSSVFPSSLSEYSHRISSAKCLKQHQCQVFLMEVNLVFL